MKKLRVHHIFVAVISLLVISFMVGFFLKSVIKRLDLIKFFDSNFFVAIITLLVGGLAIFLYWKQRNDNKRDKARLILQEIRYAEDQIRKSKTIGDGNFQLAIKLLPTNSWHQNIHLFVNDLKESQLDLISSFYSQAAYLDEVIHTISDEKNRQWGISEGALLLGGMMNFNRKKSILSSGFGFDIEQSKLITLDATAILTEVAGKIEFIYNSSAVDKLRDITEGKI